TREKSRCDSSTLTPMPRRASKYPSAIPAGPAPTTITRPASLPTIALLRPLAPTLIRRQPRQIYQQRLPSQAVPCQACRFGRRRRKRPTESPPWPPNAACVSFHGWPALSRKMPDLTTIPRHIGVIPDGNRRWAEARGLGRHEGYDYGVEP